MMMYQVSALLVRKKCQNLQKIVVLFIATTDQLPFSQYTAVIGNSAAAKNFKGDFDDSFGESIIRLFKKLCFAELKGATRDNIPFHNT